MNYELYTRVLGIPPSPGYTLGPGHFGTWIYLRRVDVPRALLHRGVGYTRTAGIPVYTFRGHKSVSLDRLVPKVNLGIRSDQMAQLRLDHKFSFDTPRRPI